MSEKEQELDHDELCDDQEELDRTNSSKKRLSKKYE